jgi:hypothetical protein
MFLSNGPTLLLSFLDICIVQVKWFSRFILVSFLLLVYYLFSTWFYLLGIIWFKLHDFFWGAIGD